MIKSKKIEGEKVICEYNSVNLKSGVYHTTTKKLEIEFNNGSKYEYEGVSHDTFAALNLAESSGKYFNSNIARKYSYKRIL